MIRRWPWAIVAVAALTSASAEAAKKNYSATLTADQENVAPDLAGKDPSASLLATFDDQTKRLCGTITFRDLTGAPTAIHVRQSPQDDPTGDGPDDRKLVIPLPAGSELAYNLLFDTEYENALNAGEIYANIYTQANPNGEVRSTLYESVDQSEAANVPCPSVTPDAGADGSTRPPSSGSSGGTDGTGITPVPAGTTTPPAAKKASASDGGCAVGGGSDALPFLAALAAIVVARARGKR
jgi:hypothetical protein